MMSSLNNFLVYLVIVFSGIFNCTISQADVDFEALNINWFAIGNQPKSVEQSLPSGFRGAFGLQALKLDLPGALGVTLGNTVALSTEVVVSGSNTGMVLNRARINLLRSTLFQLIPAEVLSYVHDNDRGLEHGLDIIRIRVPLITLADGQVAFFFGGDVGVYSFKSTPEGSGGLVGAINLNLEANVFKDLIEDWLTIGALGRVNGQGAFGNMSSHQESVIGYVAMSLDSKGMFVAKAYIGADHDSNRATLNLPTVSFFQGIGLHYAQ